MDVVLFKGTLLGSKITFGLLKKRKVLGFEKNGKYLVPKDKKSQLIIIPEEFELSKIKKTSKVTKKVLDFYLKNPELAETGYGSYLLAYYLHEEVNLEEIQEKLEEEAKMFFSPLIEKLLNTRYLKKASFFPDYYKESKVISRYALLELELVFDTLLKNIDDLVFKNKKPVKIFPLRYSTRAITDADITKISEVAGKRIRKWFSWRKVLREAPFFYNYLIYWLNEILDMLYPDDQEAIKNIAETAERDEIFSNPEILSALQENEDFEGDDFSSISYNKHLVYYFSMQFLYGDKQIKLKKYDKIPTFGYQDIFVSMSHIYTSFPFFTNFNPLFSMIAGGILEWIEKDLSFQALQGNKQMDPYNIIPNAFTFYLSLISSKTDNWRQRKFLLAKSLLDLMNIHNIKEGIKWQKQSNLAMQGKNTTIENIEISDEEAEKKRKEIEEKVDKYCKSFRLRKDKQAELNTLVSSMNKIDKKFEELKEDKSDYLIIDKKYLETLSDFQKDFLLTVQLFEEDKNKLNLLARLFDFINNFILYGSSTALYGFTLLLWMISISHKGTWDWLFQKIDEEELDEGKILSQMCVSFNTALQGLKARGNPLIETTAPTVIIQVTQNLNEILLAKDISEQEDFPFYNLILKNMSGIYEN